MNIDDTLHSLKEALKFSPDNLPLRIHIAELCFQHARYEEAEVEFTHIIKISSEHTQAQIGLAKTFYQLKKYGPCSVLLENLIHHKKVKELDASLLYTKSLIKEGRLSNAIDEYQSLQNHHPGFKDLEIEDLLKIKSNTPTHINDNLYPEQQTINFQKPSINFNDVGGMDLVKKEIELKIIKPLIHPEIYKSYGKKTGGGILMYGPPGCGKTYLAKATAGQINSRFYAIGLNEILDMWIGNSEKNLHQVFEMARDNKPCVMFFDEIDALGASRSDMKQSAGRHLINQFLQELDGVSTSNDGILIMGATNAPWHLDPAFRRPGRFDRILFIHPPDEAARVAILKIKLKDKPVEEIDYASIAKKTDGFSGADLNAMIDRAIEQKLESAFEDGVPKPITTKDLLQVLKSQHPSTKEWFGSARNFALYSNETGLYNDILDYLKLR